MRCTWSISRLWAIANRQTPSRRVSSPSSTLSGPKPSDTSIILSSTCQMDLSSGLSKESARTRQSTGSPTALSSAYSSAVCTTCRRLRWAILTRWNIAVRACAAMAWTPERKLDAFGYQVPEEAHDRDPLPYVHGAIRPSHCRSLL